MSEFVGGRLWTVCPVRGETSLLLANFLCVLKGFRWSYVSRFRGTLKSKFLNGSVRMEGLHFRIWRTIYSLRTLDPFLKPFRNGSVSVCPRGLFKVGLLTRLLPSVPISPEFCPSVRVTRSHRPRERRWMAVCKG